MTTARQEPVRCNEGMARLRQCIACVGEKYIASTPGRVICDRVATCQPTKQWTGQVAKLLEGTASEEVCDSTSRQEQGQDPVASANKRHSTATTKYSTNDTPLPFKYSHTNSHNPRLMIPMPMLNPSSISSIVIPYHRKYTDSQSSQTEISIGPKVRVLFS